MAPRWLACHSAPWPWTGTFNLLSKRAEPSPLCVVTANAEVSRMRRLCPKQLAVSVQQLSAVHALREQTLPEEERWCDSSADMLKLFISSLQHIQSFFFFWFSSISIQCEIHVTYLVFSMPNRNVSWRLFMCSWFLKFDSSPQKQQLPH